MTRPPLARENPDGSRTYHHPLTGEKYPSVTTILDVISKPQLVPWSARMAAEYAVAEWDSLTELDPPERIASIKEAHVRVATDAAVKGDAVHKIVDSWMSGRPQPDYPKTIAPFISNFISFLTEVRPVFLETEATLLSREHGFAGTCDWIAEIAGVTCLGDNKTGKRVYPEAALQLSALAACTVILREDGTEDPLPEFGRLLVLHIRPRSWHLHEVTARDSALKTFLAARDIWQWQNEVADHALRQVA